MYKRQEGADAAADAEVNGTGHWTGHVQDNAGAATPTSRRSLFSRPFFGCDTSPLADIDLLRKARQSAQAKAEATGNGKRPKIPSRKALEASGFAGVVQDAPQLMTKELRKAAAPKTARRMKNQRPGSKGNCARNYFTGQATGDVARSGGFIGRFDGNGFSTVSAAGEGESPTSEEILEEHLQHRRKHQQQQEKQQQQQHQNNKTQRLRSASLTSRRRQSPIDMTTAAGACQRRPADATPTRGANNVDTKKTTKTRKRRGGVAEKNRDMTAKKKNTSTIGGLQGEGKESAGITNATRCAFEECQARATYGVNNIVRYWYVVFFAYLPR